VEWRASVERMTAAVVRRDLSEMNLAAPAYADTPGHELLGDVRAVTVR
jgi:hypothetical protein